MKEVTFDDGFTVEITATPVYDIKNERQIRGVVLKYEDVSERTRVANEWKRAKEAAEMSVVEVDVPVQYESRDSYPPECYRGVQ